MISNLFELFKFRQLVLALVERHLSARYRGSVLGFMWSLLNPLCLMIVYTVVFHHFMRNSAIANYEIFLFCGLLPWLWVTSSLAEGASSIVSSGHLITKSLFPAHILPVVSVLTNMIHFLLSLPIMVVFMLIQGVPFFLSLAILPVVIFLQLLFLTGIVIGLGSLNVLYRDVQHIVGNAITLLFFLNPIVYSASIVPERFKWALMLNPFSLWTITYQSIILEGIIPWSNIGLLTVFSLISVIVGNLVFNNYRELFAESL
jgi:lipopolysaccharide transport system permease protein